MRDVRTTSPSGRVTSVTFRESSGSAEEEEEQGGGDVPAATASNSSSGLEKVTEANRRARHGAG